MAISLGIYPTFSDKPRNMPRLWMLWILIIIDNCDISNAEVFTHRKDGITPMMPTIS